MATVKIGERELQIRDLTRPGGSKFKRTQLLPWRARLRGEHDEEQLEAVIVDGIILYVGQNEGVDKTWLEDNLPVDTLAVLRECMRGSGEPLAEKPAAGEAARP